jgi:hypothetical protein
MHRSHSPVLCVVLLIVLLIVLLPIGLLGAVRAVHASDRVIEQVAPSSVPGRSVDVCAYRPTGPGPFPVVIFSQDLGASCHANADLGRHWSNARLLAVFVAHPGSASVDWTGRPAPPTAGDRARLTREARIDHRSGDLQGVLDALERWNRESGHPLAGTADLERVGVGGAFWGAYTAEIITGRRPVQGPPVLADRRIRSAVLLDPVGPAGIAPPSAYSAVRTPWMLVWGWRGSVRPPLAPLPRGAPRPDPAAGLAHYEAIWRGLRVQGSYELVFRDALAPRATDPRYGGGAYGDRNRDAGDRDRIVRELTTAFWNATLRNDPDARRWLNGPAARDLLRSGDRWRSR